MKFETMLNEARRVTLGLPKNTRKEELQKKCLFLPEITDFLKQKEAYDRTTQEHTVDGRNIAGFLRVRV